MIHTCEHPGVCRARARQVVNVRDGLFATARHVAVIRSETQGLMFERCVMTVAKVNPAATSLITWNAAVDACTRGVRHARFNSAFYQEQPFEDSLQNALASTWDAWHRGRVDLSKGNGSGYFYMIGVWTVLGERRRKSCQRVHYHDANDLDWFAVQAGYQREELSDPDEEARRAALELGISFLPRRQRNVIRMELGRFGVQDIEVNRTPAYRTKLCRARKRLRAWVPRILKLIIDHPRPFSAKVRRVPGGDPDGQDDRFILVDCVAPANERPAARKTPFAADLP